MENSVKQELIFIGKEHMVCHGCLGTHKLYDMWQYHLVEPYQHLIGIQMTPGCTAHLCYICATLLLKYEKFRNKCKENKWLLENEIVDVFQQNQIHSYKKSKMYTTTYPELESNLVQFTIECKTDLPDIPSVKTEADVDVYPIQIKIEQIDDAEMSENTEKTEKTEQTEKAEQTEKKEKKKKVRERKKVKRKRKKSDSTDDGVPDYDLNPVTFKQKGRYFETKENMTNFQKMFQCDIKVLSMDEQLQEIKERKDSFNYPYRCSDCYKGFMDEDNLRKHNGALHDPSRGDAVCEVCKICYKDNRDLNRHLKTHRLKFTCRQCKHVCKTTSKAMEHFKIHGGQLYKCDYCGKTYEKQSTFLTHIRVVHPSELIWCELCGESFVSDFGLNCHKKQTHSEIQYPPDAICEKCNIQFINTDALRVHTDGASCESVASCVHCGHSFTTRLLLKDHLFTHRPGAVVGHYPCVKCDKIFPRQNLYSAHYRRVHADSSRARKYFVCETCGKSLPNKCELRYHQRTHTGERPYACPHCPKNFTKHAFMKAHMRVHSSERPFACKLCPKTFKGPAALSGHQYVHTGIKPPVRRKKKMRLQIDSSD